MPFPAQIVLCFLLLPASVFVTVADENNTLNPFEVVKTKPAEKTLNEKIEVYLQAIEKIESQEGAYSDKLAQELSNLGDIYQRYDKHDKAIEIYNRSLHLNRINDGLYSHLQIPTVNKIISSLRSQQKWDKINNKYNYLYWLHQRKYKKTDIEMLEITNRVANWNLKSYANRYSETPGQNLLNAYNLFNRSLAIISLHYGEHDLSTIKIIHSLMIVNYFFATFNIDTIPTNNAFKSEYGEHSKADNRLISLKRRSFVTGREILEKELVVLQNQKNINHFQVSEVKLRLADWHLLFEKRQSAMSLYQTTYHYVLDHSEENSYKNLFSKPVALPNLPNLETNLQDDVILASLTPDIKFVEASFDVTRHGKAKNITIINSNIEENTRLRSRALKSLRLARFRPKLEEGIPTRTEKMQLHVFP